MPCCPINNIARIGDVRQLVPVESFPVSNELIPNQDAIVYDVSPSPETRPVEVLDKKQTTDNDSQAISKLVGVMTRFFAQLINLLPDKKDKKESDVPLPRPGVTPKVAPEPVAPKPDPVVPRPDIHTSLPGLSSKRNGAKPDNIWSGFRQGPDGNCVTVSAIKAAMYRFGQSPTDIYKEVVKVSDGYRVGMRDGFQLSLTNRELAEGARGARFVGPDKDMLKDAQFLFAVSAKRAQMENNDRTAGRSYQAAIKSLNNGEDESGPGEGFQRLGLKQHMKRVPVRELARGQVGMCNRTGHSVAVINGREELWGRRGSVPTRGDAVALM